MTSCRGNPVILAMLLLLLLLLLLPLVFVFCLDILV
jgi:hypothetical protein